MGATTTEGDTAKEGATTAEVPNTTKSGDRVKFQVSEPLIDRRRWQMTRRDHGM